MNHFLNTAAQGLPSIASNIAAVPEVVLDCMTGILVSPMDVQTTADALERLLKKQEVLSELGKEAQDWAKSFSWERCAKESYG
ncbi:glycosyltransferase [Candidatus Neomarinimicrobiota bacterium]